MGEFEDLPKSTKRKLVKLMARISEKSYRRGVQQALAVGFTHKSVSDWRYGDMNKSKGIDTPCTFSTKDRFFQQNSEITQVGFREG